MASINNHSKLSEGGHDFIDDAYLRNLLNRKTDRIELRDIIAKSTAKKPLEMEEAAVLLGADEPEQIEQMLDAARQLKQAIYGNRIVLFAPLYIGNRCVNDCRYCAFRVSNKDAARRTLNKDDIGQQVASLQNQGHKRLIIVFGDHPTYTPDFMADCVRDVYDVEVGNGKIRRVNINAAPLDHEGYAKVKAAGIGTYQIFQETYHHNTYEKVHPPKTNKSDYLWRLDSQARAIEAECDDVGIGALFGLYDWRFEVLGLVAHSLNLQKRFGIGPHTISVPRLKPAFGAKIDQKHIVNDEQLKRLVAILRLSVPYTGLILTARETPEVRRDVIEFGVSQIDAGSRIELGGYTEVGDTQIFEREQFELGDIRGLDEVMGELLNDGYLPSFCTSCYRLGRTGQHFMELAAPGFIQNMCTPNAIATLKEYLIDYASPKIRLAGNRLIATELEKFPDGNTKKELLDKLRLIEEAGSRDMLF